METLDQNDAALAAAIALLGGAIAPLAVALKKIGWPGRNRAGIHRHLRDGTLPVRAQKIGGRLYVTAGSVADLLRSTPTPPSNAVVPVRRGPGRPRKAAGSAP